MIVIPAMSADLVEYLSGGCFFVLREVNAPQDKTGVGHVGWIYCVTIV
jgi:hypothetical protein